MGKVDVLKETTPLSSEDCFLVMQRPKSGFNFPLHVHMEFELNYLENAAGAIRISFKLSINVFPVHFFKKRINEASLIFVNLATSDKVIRF